MLTSVAGLPEGIIPVTRGEPAELQPLVARLRIIPVTRGEPKQSASGMILKRIIPVTRGELQQHY